jgi:tight adherence protein C
MVILFLVSAAMTVFIVATMLILTLSGHEALDSRLLEITARRQSVTARTLTERSKTGLAGLAGTVTRALKPIQGLISGADEDLSYRLTLAGFRKAQHVEVYTAAKMLLPVLGIAAGTFFGPSMLTAILVGAVVGFFGPDFVLGYLIARRRASVSRVLPDALDLLVICLEAGLGLDQAVVRVGEEIRLNSPALSEEIQIITREQRAGKLRLEAWRSMAERVDVVHVRQFVSMLVQTERFGTPIAQSLGQFSDMLRMRRTQEAEERAAKSGVKLLLPLVFFIFPSIFVVSIGPAILDFLKLFENLRK